MREFSFLFLIALCLFECVPSEWSPEKVCGNSNGRSRTLKLSVNSRKNESLEWEDTFTALAESSISSNRMVVDLTHAVFECDSKRSIFIQGITNAPTSAAAEDRLHFHVRCGKNAAILKGGRSAQKIKDADPLNSQVFTHRPLRNGEIFEVKLEKKNSIFNYSLGIGIIMQSPDSVNILPEMYRSPVTWINYHGHIYSNAAEQIKNYGKDINKLLVGDTVGVMRSEFGTLHFFVNGEDQGPAASNIPSPVYGLVDLWNNAMKVSIVD